MRLYTPAFDPARDHGVAMPFLLQAPRTELTTLLDAYARDFEWYAFCLVCGHVPERGQQALQALYQAQARWRGSRMQELYPLVCAHWAWCISRTRWRMPAANRSAGRWS